MSTLTKVEEAIKDKSPEDVKKRAPRKKEVKESTAPINTQKGKRKKKDAEQALKLIKERHTRVINRMVKTKAEKNLLKLSTKQLKSILDKMDIDNLSNLRKEDLILLVFAEWKTPTV